MLRFSEGPRDRAISASSIPVAECQVPFVSVSFTRDTYRVSKTLKDEKRGETEEAGRRRHGERARERENEREGEEGWRKERERERECLRMAPRPLALTLLVEAMPRFFFLPSSPPFPLLLRPPLSLSNGDLSSARKALNPFTHCSATDGSRVDRSDSPEFFEFRSWVLSGGEVNCVFKYA